MTTGWACGRGLILIYGLSLWTLSPGVRPAAFVNNGDSNSLGLPPLERVFLCSLARPLHRQQFVDDCSKKHTGYSQDEQKRAEREPGVAVAYPAGRKTPRAGRRVPARGQATSGKTTDAGITHLEEALQHRELARWNKFVRHCCAWEKSRINGLKPSSVVSRPNKTGLRKPARCTR